MTQESGTPWLSDAEVLELTGYKRSSCQARWLRDNGIRCYINALGKVRVPRDALTSLPGTKQRKPTEPDFSKVRRIN
jgi:predicted site-specific integrase-resolvase